MFTLTCFVALYQMRAWRAGCVKHANRRLGDKDKSQVRTWAVHTLRRNTIQFLLLSSAGWVKTLTFTESQESNVRGSGSSEAWNKFFRNT
jgi:hypothetical protein